MRPWFKKKTEKDSARSSVAVEILNLDLFALTFCLFVCLFGLETGFYCAVQAGLKLTL